MASTALVTTQDASSSAAAPALNEPTLTGIQPISIKKTLMLVNNFVLNTTDFLNKFSLLCEQKLSHVSQQIQRVEIVLSLLEAKLDSIQWMGGGLQAQAAAQTTTTAGIAASPSSSSSAPTAPPMNGSVPNAPSAPAPSAPPAPAANVMKLRDDPRYSKYFKMLNMGVPKPAVKQKMANDGCPDPDQIDNDPDGPAPPGGEAAMSQALVAIDGGGDGSESEKSDAMSDED